MMSSTHRCRHVAVLMVAQVPALLVGNMLRGNPWKKVDLCIGKVAELYGD